MSERRRHPEACEAWADQLPEVAFSVREPSDTPGLAAHLDRCAACRHELAGLAATADRLVLLAPDVDPPEGFEHRVLGALVPAGPDEAAPAAAVPAATAVPAGRRPRRHHRPARWAAAAAVGVLVAVAAFLAGRATGSGTPVATSPESAVLETTDGEAAGGVVLAAGRRPSLTVWLDRPRPGVAYTCVLVMSDGSRRDVGWWTGAEGERSWTVDLGEGDLGAHRVEITGRGGRVVAAADLH